MNSQEKRQLFNICILGFAFLFIFGAFQTSIMFQTTLLNDVRKEHNSTFTGSGYQSLAIIYLTFAFANWISPIVMVWIRPKYSMAVSSIIYALFMATFLKPMNWSLYLGSFLVGVATAVLWTSQGNFLSLNSNSKTIGRNTTIFWVLFQSSLIFGNAFQYLLFKEAHHATEPPRRIMYSVFTAGCIVGCILLLMLQRPVDITELNIVTSDGDLDTIPTEYSLQQYSTNYTPLEAFFQSFRLLKTKTMFPLLLVFAYTGFELTFVFGVFCTSVGHMEYFGKSAKGFIGLIGIAIGIGEITSTLMFTCISRLWSKITPDFIILIGLFVHITSFYLIFLSLPFIAPLCDVSGMTFIKPRMWVLILCGYLLGTGDSIFNTQVISLLADTYKGIDSPSAFALYKFVQSLTSAAGFFYCSHLRLPWQLLILATLAIFGTMAFVYVENRTRIIALARHKSLSLTYDSMDER